MRLCLEALPVSALAQCRQGHVTQLSHSLSLQQGRDTASEPGQKQHSKQACRVSPCPAIVQTALCTRVALEKGSAALQQYLSSLALRGNAQVESGKIPLTWVWRRGFSSSCSH